MLIRLLSTNQVLDLPEGVKLSVEIHNPLFSEMGSTTLPIELPATPHNITALGLQHGMMRATRFQDNYRVMIEAGSYRKSGKMNLLGLSTRSVSVNILLDESEIYNKIENVTLSEVMKGRTTGRQAPYLFLPAINWEPSTHDYMIFPMRIGTDTTDEDSALFINRTDISNTTSAGWEGFNEGAFFKFYGDTKRTYSIDGTDVETGIGFGVSPQLRVGFVLGAIFEYLGIELDNNIFNTDEVLKYACVCNNSIDAAMTSDPTYHVVYYQHLVPSCSISQFIDAIRNIFSVEVIIDSTGHAKMARHTDLLTSDATRDITERLSADPSYTIGEKRMLSFTSDTEALNNVYLTRYTQTRKDMVDMQGNITSTTFEDGGILLDEQFSPLTSIDDLESQYIAIDPSWDGTINNYKTPTTFSNSNDNIGFVQQYEAYYYKKILSVEESSYNSQGIKLRITKYVCCPIGMGTMSAKAVPDDYATEEKKLGNLLPNIRGFLTMPSYRLVKSYVEVDGQGNASGTDTVDNLDIYFAFSRNPYYPRRTYKAGSYDIMNGNDCCLCAVDLASGEGFSLLPTGPQGATERNATYNNMLQTAMHTATVAPNMDGRDASSIVTTEKVICKGVPMMMKTLKYEIDDNDHINVLDSEYLTLTSLDNE